MEPTGIAAVGADTDFALGGEGTNWSDIVHESCWALFPLQSAYRGAETSRVTSSARAECVRAPTLMMSTPRAA